MSEPLNNTQSLKKRRSRRGRRTQATTRQAVERDPFIPPRVAAVLSLVLPGLGQLLVRRFSRGAILIAAWVTLLGLSWWRVAELAHRGEPGFLNQFVYAYARRPAFISILVISLALIWLFAAIDSWRSGTTRRTGGPAVLLLVLLGFFVVGWQIARIDVVRLVRDFPDAMEPLGRVIWPWEAAFTFETEDVAAFERVRVIDPNEAENSEAMEPPEATDRATDEPWIEVEPRVGYLSYQDEQFESQPGTEITVRGGNFEPQRRTEIWWRDPTGNEFRPRMDGEYIAEETTEDGSFELSFTMPFQISPENEQDDRIHRIEARQRFRVGGPKPSEALVVTTERMIETIFMGMMATLFGIVFAIPFSFLAARNIMSGSRMTLAVYYVVRGILNVVRSIEALIWALIAVVWVGLGPFAGIVALTLHSVAALGKLYSEAIEGIDPGPIEAVQSTGASRLQTIVHAVIPQMISPFVSFSIYRWDINVRMSTVIGLVGGGGVGFILVQYIRLLDYRSAGIAVWFIAITVAVLDYVSAEIRARML